MKNYLKGRHRISLKVILNNLYCQTHEKNFLTLYSIRISPPLLPLTKFCCILYVYKEEKKTPLECRLFYRKYLHFNTSSTYDDSDFVDDNRGNQSFFFACLVIRRRIKFHFFSPS